MRLHTGRRCWWWRSHPIVVEFGCCCHCRVVGFAMGYIVCFMIKLCVIDKCMLQNVYKTLLRGMLQCVHAGHAIVPTHVSCTQQVASIAIQWAIWLTVTHQCQNCLTHRMQCPSRGPACLQNVQAYLTSLHYICMWDGGGGGGGSLH